MEQLVFTVTANGVENRQMSYCAPTAFVAHRHCAEFLLGGWPILKIAHRNGATGDVAGLEWLLNSIG